MDNEDNRPDLASLVVRDSYRNPHKSDLMQIQSRPLASIRRAVAESKRFMLDGPMSEFLAELASVPFRVAPERQPDVLDSLRHSAIPPFPKMFVQIDGRAFRRGLLRAAASKLDAWGDKLLAPDDPDVTPELGFLIERQQGNDDVTITEFFEYPEHNQMTSLPFVFTYRLSDVGFTNSERVSTKAGIFAHGIMGYHDRCTAIILDKPISQIPKRFLLDVVNEEMPSENFKSHFLVPEYGSVARYMFAFLSTLNNVPKVVVEVRTSKGYLAGGQIRKYLDHTVLKLSLPAKQSTTMVAKRLIAAARKGWHEVRAHWRITHPRLGGNYCESREAHVWGAADSTGHATCKVCEARRVWIVLPHGRGDPTISVRTHKYSVTHPT